ncbi:MAG: DedA family protein [Spirochaetes bacterium]|nr:DedA family protein [Spirochaetota bacterium]MBP8987642.1 DedA family protein [Spirochaetota bacterium]HQQ51947.1 YqaA family protein [Spirochaetota bacterium]
MHVHRFLYDWVLSWAHSPFGERALFVLALAESSFFPVPPDVLLIALVLGKRETWLRLAILCSIASVIGGLAGYAIGHFLWYSGDSYSSIALFFFNNIPGFTIESFNAVSKLYDVYSFWIVFTAGFTPIPYKIITITAGVANINVSIFVVASVISRSLRFFLVAWLIFKFGESINAFINKWFNVLSIAFVVLLIGGFYVLKYVV